MAENSVQENAGARKPVAKNMEAGSVEKVEEVPEDQMLKSLSIGEKLAYIQGVLNAPKNRYNSHGKYPYRSLEDITEALKPLLKLTGARMMFVDKIEMLGARFYVRATAVIICNATNERIETTGFAREVEARKGMDESMITGTASSYARKYAANGMFLIDDTRDEDSINHEHDGGDNQAVIQPTFSKAVNDALNSLQTAWKANKDDDVIEVWKALPHLDKQSVWGALSDNWKKEIGHVVGVDFKQGV